MPPRQVSLGVRRREGSIMGLFDWLWGKRTRKADQLPVGPVFLGNVTIERPSEQQGLDELLLALLQRLERIGPPLWWGSEASVDVCIRLQDTLWDGFIKRVSDFRIPDEYGFHSAECDRHVQQALATYITEANAKAVDLGICAFHSRLQAVQNDDVETLAGRTYVDFFGYYGDVDQFDEQGNLTRKSRDKVLKAVGYWKPNWVPADWPLKLPEPKNLVKPGWHRNDLGRIVAYLKGGRKFRGWLGYSWCRLGCVGENMGTMCFYDGE
jgi:hypothetical protein